MSKIIVVAIVSIIVSGCVHPRNSYHPINFIPSSPFDGEPQYQFVDKMPSDDIHDMMANGYVCSGQILPECSRYTTEQILELMKEKRHEVGHGYNIDGGIATGVMPLPVMSTHYSTGNFSAYGGGLMVNGYGNTTTMSMSTQYVPYQHRVIYATYMFFNRPAEKFRFGAFFDNLTRDEEVRIGTRKAIKVSVVVKESPAWKADIFDDDIILEINGKKPEQMMSAVKEIANTHGELRLKIWRGGSVIEKIVTLP